MCTHRQVSNCPSTSSNRSYGKDYSRREPPKNCIPSLKSPSKLRLPRPSPEERRSETYFGSVPEVSFNSGQRSLLQCGQLPGHPPQHALRALPGRAMCAHTDEQRVLVLCQIQLLRCYQLIYLHGSYAGSLKRCLGRSMLQVGICMFESMLQVEKCMCRPMLQVERCLCRSMLQIKNAFSHLCSTLKMPVQIYAPVLRNGCPPRHRCVRCYEPLSAQLAGRDCVAVVGSLTSMNAHQKILRYTANESSSAPRRPHPRCLRRSGL